MRVKWRRWRRVSVVFVLADFVGFVALYNMAGVEWAWTYVFFVTSAICLTNLLDAIRQLRANKRARIDGAIELINENALEQESLRTTQALLWMSAGILAIFEVRSRFTIWVLLAGAFSLRASSLLTVYLRHRIDEFETSGQFETPKGRGVNSS